MGPSGGTQQRSDGGGVSDNLSLSRVGDASGKGVQTHHPMRTVNIDCLCVREDTKTPRTHEYCLTNMSRSLSIIAG